MIEATYQEVRSTDMSAKNSNLMAYSLNRCSSLQEMNQCSQ